MQTKQLVSIKDWNVMLEVNDSKHLTVYASNKDDSEVFQIETELGTAKAPGARFTSQGIEEDFAATGRKEETEVWHNTIR